MKILHTSDLHVGRTLGIVSLYEDQKYILTKIVEIIKERAIDVLLISGDIYDRSLPSAQAVNLLDEFFVELSKTKAEVLIISGNHDSMDRLAFGEKFFEKDRIHIASRYEGKMKVFEKDDVKFYMMPFIREAHVMQYMSEEERKEIRDANSLMKWALDREDIDKKKKNILLLHQFVAKGDQGLEMGGSETITTVGTLDKIDVSILDDFAYVALGHIHRSQSVGRSTVRYSGTPMRYSFDEAKIIQAKDFDKEVPSNSILLYDTDSEEVERIPLKPLRELRVVEDTFENLLHLPDTKDYLSLRIIDENPPASASSLLTNRYENVVNTIFVGRMKEAEKRLGLENNEAIEEKSSMELFKELFMDKMAREMNEEEISIMENIINKVESEEEDEN